MTTRISRRSVLAAGAAAGVAGLLARPAVAVAQGGDGGTALTHVTVIDPASGRWRRT